MEVAECAMDYAEAFVVGGDASKSEDLAGMEDACADLVQLGREAGAAQRAILDTVLSGMAAELAALEASLGPSLDVCIAHADAKRAWGAMYPSHMIQCCEELYNLRHALAKEIDGSVDDLMRAVMACLEATRAQATLRLMPDLRAVTRLAQDIEHAWSLLPAQSSIVSAAGASQLRSAFAAWYKNAAAVLPTLSDTHPLRDALSVVVEQAPQVLSDALPDVREQAHHYVAGIASIREAAASMSAQERLRGDVSAAHEETIRNAAQTVTETARQAVAMESKRLLALAIGSVVESRGASISSCACSNEAKARSMAASVTRGMIRIDDVEALLRERCRVVSACSFASSKQHV